MYRLQVYDRNIMGMHWHVHKDPAHCLIEGEIVRAPHGNQTVPATNQILSGLAKAAGIFLDCRVLFPETADPLVLLQTRDCSGIDGLARLFSP